MAQIVIDDWEGSAYIHLRAHAGVCKSVLQPNMVTFDYDAEGNLVGIELGHLESVVHVNDIGEAGYGPDTYRSGPQSVKHDTR